MSPEVEKENQQTVGLKDNFPSLCDMVFQQEWGWGTHEIGDETQELACLNVSPKTPRQPQRQDLMKLSILSERLVHWREQSSSTPVPVSL